MPHESIVPVTRAENALGRSDSGSFPHPSVDDVLANTQSPNGLRGRNPSFPNQLNRLKLKLSGKYPASHNLPC